MGSKVYFMNNGYFDIRAMLTFGVSAKTGDEAIGYFGTGFKYSVAIVLRLGGSVKVETNGETYTFERRRETIRDQEFDLVYMNDREAGFTTRLGVNWEPWMAFRELYCNCTDEAGEISDQRSEFDTVITVDCPEIYKAYQSKGDYILLSKPILSGDAVDIHEGPSQFIYYRGIAVCMQSEASSYTYNIKSQVELTEDRTSKHWYQIKWPLQQRWQSLTDRPMLRKIVRSADSFEAKVGFDKDWSTSDEFAEVCQEMMRTDTGINESARLLLKHLDQKAGNWPEFHLTKVQLQMLEKACAFLAGIGVTVRDFPIKTVQGLGDGVMGRAMDGTIFLSETPFHMGTKQLASTLMEEWVHNKLGCADFDRRMQSWLFDKVLSVGEEINGEPL